MLRGIRSAADIPLDGVSRVYGGRADEDFLRFDFFTQSGAVLWLWLEDGEAVSALRTELWKDGVLVTALQTASGCENLGYATILLQEVLERLGQQGTYRVYAHIHHRNRASICVHEKCGFRRIADTARLLDGTVTAQMCTYLFDNK